MLLKTKQEEEETSEFFLSLEKDLQQEDYLQGRMQGNPYSSKEPGLGPLMRDVKNKICIGNNFLFISNPNSFELDFLALSFVYVQQ